MKDTKAKPKAQPRKKASGVQAKAVSSSASTFVRADLVSLLAKNLNWSKTEASLNLSLIISTLEQALTENDRIKLVGFGTFKKRIRKARKGRNPQTGEIMTIEPKTVIMFKAGEPLLAKIANTGASQ